MLIQFHEFFHSFFQFMPRNLKVPNISETTGTRCRGMSKGVQFTRVHPTIQMTLSAWTEKEKADTTLCYWSNILRSVCHEPSHLPERKRTGERERERNQWVFLLSAGRNSVPAAFLILVQQRPSASQTLPQFAATLHYNLIYTALYDLCVCMGDRKRNRICVCVRKEERAPLRYNERQTEFMKLINSTGSEQCSLSGLPFLQCSI